jgi:hypothetical protein
MTDVCVSTGEMFSDLANFYFDIFIIRQTQNLARFYTIQLLCLTGNKDIVDYAQRDEQTKN